jgi:hypothetical protein
LQPQPQPQHLLQPLPPLLVRLQLLDLNNLEDLVDMQLHLGK